MLRRPVVTEKNTMLNAEGKYIFEVAPDGEQDRVKRAVEEVFKVQVSAVNVINVRGKIARRGWRRTPGMTRSWKKAIVTLEAGERIELFQGV